MTGNLGGFLDGIAEAVGAGYNVAKLMLEIQVI
jgi:hypothetical protein